MSAGPWTIYADSPRLHHGTLIVALGRTAGSAISRSRIRRIARDVFWHAVTDRPMPLDVLLLARSNVSSRSRRQVRADLSGLIARAFSALAIRGVKTRTNA